MDNVSLTHTGMLHHFAQFSSHGVVVRNKVSSGYILLHMKEPSGMLTIHERESLTGGDVTIIRMSVAHGCMSRA